MNASWATIRVRQALRWIVPASAAAMFCVVLWLLTTSMSRSTVSALAFVLPGAVIVAVRWLEYRFAAGNPRAAHVRTVLYWFLSGS